VLGRLHAAPVQDCLLDVDELDALRVPRVVSVSNYLPYEDGKGPDVRGMTKPLEGKGLH